MTVQDDDLPPQAANSKRLAKAFWEASPELSAEFYNLEKCTEPSDRQKQNIIVAQIREILLLKLRYGLLSAWGRDGSPYGSWRGVPSSAWPFLHVENLRSGIVAGLGMLLFDTRIGVPVVPDPPASAPAPPLPETGAPGRPSSMHLVLLKFRERAEANELETSLAREAATLAAWFRKEYPKKQPLAPGTIENKIRSDFRRLAPSRPNLRQS